jgi:hypothetical protein
MNIENSFLEVNAAGAWSWLPTSIHCREECMLPRTSLWRGSLLIKYRDYPKECDFILKWCTRLYTWPLSIECAMDLVESTEDCTVCMGQNRVLVTVHHSPSHSPIVQLQTLPPLLTIILLLRILGARFEITTCIYMSRWQPQLCPATLFQETLK